MSLFEWLFGRKKVYTGRHFTKQDAERLAATQKRKKEIKVKLQAIEDTQLDLKARELVVENAKLKAQEAKWLNESERYGGVPDDERYYSNTDDDDKEPENILENALGKVITDAISRKSDSRGKGKVFGPDEESEDAGN